MKHILFASLMAFVFGLSACDQQSGVTSPVDSQSPVAIGEQFINPDGFDSDILMDDRGTADGRIDLRRIADMEAMAWIRLLLAANPEMDDATKAALKAALEASNQRRAEIVKDTELTPEQKKAALEAEHKALMDIINGSEGNPGLVGVEQIEKAQALKEKLEQERKERLEKQIEARIDMQIKAWDRMLKFTEEQKTAIKDILLQQQKDIAAKRVELANDPAALRAALAAIQKTANEAIRALLDETQAKIWDRMHGRVGNGGGGRGGVGGRG